MNTRPPTFERPQPLQNSLKLITIAGCLAMVFATGTGSPVFVQFMREIGATDAHFGLLGGIPMIMLGMQFAGAVVTNGIRRRKPLFMILVISGRFLYIPMAIIPAASPALRGITGVWFVLICLALAGAMLNISGPLWLSWMADLIPRRVLNTYWGQRQKWMYITWTMSYLVIAAFVSLATLPALITFPILATLAAIAGIVDILLFIHVHEPPNTVTNNMPILETALAPLRNKEFRPFVMFSCTWAAVTMFAATFMQIYALKRLGISVWQATLIWSVTGIGIALVSTHWGRLADKHGHRPILLICIGLKSIVVLVFLLSTPNTVLWLLPITFFFDSFWNAGIMVASNGYMLKIAPQQNRSMFIAAIAGLAGICGGIGAITGGFFLELTINFEQIAFGRVWTNYHLLFAISIILRWICIAFAYRIHEPKATAPDVLLSQLRGTWPMRFLLFPVGLYRRNNNSESNL